jgi:hypothetical protein
LFLEGQAASFACWGTIFGVEKDNLPLSVEVRERKRFTARGGEGEFGRGFSRKLVCHVAASKLPLKM